VSSETFPKGCLLVFTKPAVPGKVKTRLVGDLTPQQTAQLHEAFLGDLVERLAGGPFDLRIAWALGEGEAAPEIPALERQPEALRQGSGDLGERLLVTLAEACRHYPYAAAVGSDHPELARETVSEAFRRLADGAPVVLGPAADGGYYLIGVTAKTAVPELFRGIPWSTDAVLGITHKRCRRIGVEPSFLEAGEDVDTPEDLQRLAGRLERGEVHCPRTRQLLERWGSLQSCSGKGERP
jgi:rSAM/selenodomain-associated transferase 1